MQTYSNQHLIEVIFGFQFERETTQWDSTLFGRFYEKIFKKGFTEKEDRKGIEFTFGMSRNIPMMQNQQVEDQVIFRTKEKDKAILMGRNKISFHITKNYTTWSDFLQTFIIPYFEIYKELELGNGERECNLVYLNKFTKSRTNMLADYFRVVSPLNSNLGIEATTTIQRILDNGPNLLISKFQSQLQNDVFNIHLECGARNKDIFAKNSTDWISQANSTHAPVRNFFESLITDKLRGEL